MVRSGEHGCGLTPVVSSTSPALPDPDGPLSEKVPAKAIEYVTLPYTVRLRGSVRVAYCTGCSTGWVYCRKLTRTLMCYLR